MRILCFGSLNIDKVYSVQHFVQAGETIASQGYSLFPGGKGLNQSVAAAKAGADVYHAGAMGGDGQMLLDVLRDSGTNTGLVQTLGDSTSGHAIIQVDSSGQNCIIIHAGANGCITEAYVDEVLKNFSAGDVILLQNEINNIPYIMEKAYAKGMTIAFNPSPITDEILSVFPLDKVGLFIMNEIEGAYLSGKKEPDDILAEMRKKFPNADILLTLGSMGSCYMDAEHFYTESIVKVQAVDTTAAGDTFTGYFLAARSRGKSVPESLHIASAAAGIAVSREGASISIPYWEEVIDFIK